ncbi:MAG: signal peptidase I [Candidatus Thorarchaeota archaeon]
MGKIRTALKWDQRSELVKTVFLLGIVVGGTLGSYGLFMVAMGTTSPIVVVTSESMEPTIYKGDLLIIQARAQEDILLRDIVVYQDTVYHPEGPIVHRIVMIEEINDVTYYTTRGDNNSGNDPGVRTYEEIIGVVVGTIPWVGNISLFLRTPAGIGVMALIFIAILVLPELFGDDDEDEKEDLEVEIDEPTETS